jgi:hypothetical protein
LVASYLDESFLSWRGFFLLSKSMEPISLIYGPVWLSSFSSSISSLTSLNLICSFVSFFSV